jgi:hypothetical protein
MKLKDVYIGQIVGFYHLGRAFTGVIEDTYQVRDVVNDCDIDYAKVNTEYGLRS